ncbi:hypothetical protein PENSTE_c012G00225 [Penicillium steckii]|uniref:Zn(2)-C6 fungal-type domain-containing protein n=1 Tax=Penicillium steckii TaxID=303698 RepID=A0A1V6T445_9EURO|nr:hypothetical protein PENSTE_c012G00225 [Penicillium steckii]
MPGVPSSKKCDRCKDKHLKCNANRPHCDKCVNAGVECPGYSKRRKFIDQGASLRRRYAPYEGPENSGSTFKNTYVGKYRLSRPESDTTGPQEPSPPIGDDFALQNETRNPEPNIEGIGGLLDVVESPITRQVSNTSRILRDSERSPRRCNNGLSRFSINREPRIGSISNTAHSPASANSYLESAAIAESPQPTGQGTYLNRSLSISSGNASQQVHPETFGCSWSKSMLEPGDELSFLLRHYTDVIGPWLDLSDSDQFFSVHVPLRALDNMPLKLTMAAIAAKHFGQMKEMNHAPQGISGQLFSSGKFGTFSQIDWVLKCSNYYALAVSGIAQETSTGVPMSEFALSSFPVEAVSSWVRLNLLDAKLKPTSKSREDKALVRKTEELLAMIVLLKLYELIGIEGHKWPGHLTGIRPLFDLMVEVYKESESPFSHGIRASFWNFVRQDFYGSYFTRSASHLDPYNLRLWRCAGVKLTEENKFFISPRTERTPSEEDQAGNGVVWIVFKIINFLAKVKQAQMAHWAGSHDYQGIINGESHDGQNNYPDPNIWLRLCFELQEWLGIVPETFRPSLRVEKPSESTLANKEQNLIFPEMVFGLPSCASAIQHYHFGRIALLLNQPTDPINSLSVSFDRLHGYREVTKEVEFHVREICGVALGRPQNAVRLPMIPILYAVGQCLVSPHERQILVELLQDVEKDLAWPTNYAIQLLQTSWNR